MIALFRCIRLRACFIGSASALPLVVAGGAYAQETTPLTTPTSSTEITVTATRRSESLSKISASVAAMDEKAMAVRGIKNIDQISAMTPGVSLNATGFGNNTDISIRGIDSQVGSATTGIYIDDTPIMTRSIGYSATNSYPLIFDLDRVEVLRGPQGTLFGTGSEGGTIRFITPQPSLTQRSVYARGEIAGTDGGAASYEGGAAIGIPIIEGRLGLRLSAWGRRDGGYIDRKNLNPGLNGAAPVDRNANSSDTQVVRGALAWAPIPELTVTLSVFFQNRQIHDVSTYWEGFSAPDAGKFVNGQPLRQPYHDRFVLPALNIKYDGGAFDIISNTSLFKRHDYSDLDYSTQNPAIFSLFSPSGYYFAGPNWVPDPNDPTKLDTGYLSHTVMENRQTAWAQEFRAQSKNSNARLTWTVGLFLSKSIQRAYETIYDPKFAELFGLPQGTDLTFFGLPNLINGNIAMLGRGSGIDSQVAGFAEANWKVTGKLKLTGGLRVARAIFEGTGYGSGPFAGGTLIEPQRTIKETPVTPKVSLSYQMDDNNLLYATAAKGYRIGGSNPALSTSCLNGPGGLLAQGYTAARASYESDHVWSYEAGVKSRLFGHHLDINASAYHIDWNNIQQSVYVSACGQAFVDNLGKAQSNGFDLQFTARPVKGLTFDGAIGYTDATFSADVNKSPATAFNVVSKGDHLDTNPWTVVLGATYEHAVFGDGAFYGRVDYTYHSVGLTSPVNNPANGGFDPSALPAPETNLVNLRAGLRKDGYDVSLFANNLLNSSPRLTRYSEVIGNPVHRDITFRPLTIGLAASYRY